MNKHKNILTKWAKNYKLETLKRKLITLNKIEAKDKKTIRKMAKKNNITQKEIIKIGKELREIFINVIKLKERGN